MHTISIYGESSDGDGQPKPSVPGRSGIEVEDSVSGVDGGLVRVAVHDDAEAASGWVQIDEVELVEEVDDGPSSVGGDIP